MRVELVRGRYLLLGGLIRSDQVRPGQSWSSSSGSVVTIHKIEDGWVTYSGPHQPEHSKLVTAFQSKYCLVLDGPELPEEFK